MVFVELTPFIAFRTGQWSDEELRTLTEVIETYEARRWPTGKDAGGKG